MDLPQGRFYMSPRSRIYQPHSVEKFNTWSCYSLNSINKCVFISTFNMLLWLPCLVCTCVCRGGITSQLTCVYIPLYLAVCSALSHAKGQLPTPNILTPYHMRPMRTGMPLYDESSLLFTLPETDLGSHVELCTGPSRLLGGINAAFLSLEDPSI